MIELDEGLVLSGRCTWGNMVGFICEIGRATYRIRWIDGEFTTQARPDLDDEDCELLQAAE